MKIAIVGYFGYANLGDEAILQSVLSQLSKYHKSLKITVFSNTPQETANRYKVGSLARMSVSSLFAGVSDCDILLFAGGSLFQDTTSFRSLLYYLFLIFLGRLYRKKIILYSQGIEPLRHLLSKWLVRYFFAFAHYISVRDLESYKYLSEDLKIKKSVHYTADSALMITPYQKDNKFKDSIGINFMNLDGFPIEHVAQELTRFAKKKEKKLIFIPFNKDDEVIGEMLRKHINDVEYTIYNDFGTVSDLLGIMQQLDFLVGGRLHSLILSAAAYLPFIGIHYHDKVESFSKEVKQNYISFADLQNGLFYSNLEIVSIDKEKYQNQLRFLVEQLKEKSKDNLINNILIKYDNQYT